MLSRIKSAYALLLNDIHEIVYFALPPQWRGEENQARAKRQLRVCAAMFLLVLFVSVAVVRISIGRYINGHEYDRKVAQLESRLEQAEARIKNLDDIAIAKAVATFEAGLVSSASSR